MSPLRRERQYGGPWQCPGARQDSRAGWARPSGEPRAARVRRGPAERPAGALAEELFERVVRLAATVPDTSWASVRVAGKRLFSRRACLARTRAEAHGETRPSVIPAAMSQALPDWLTGDPRLPTAVYAVTLAPKGSRYETGGQPGCGGSWLAAAQSRQTGRTTPTAAAAVTARMPLQTTTRCPRPAMVRCFRPQWVMLMLNRPVGPAVRW
jgi:hypothetical protein